MPHFDQYIVEGRPRKLKWHEGALTHRNKFEVLLYHLIKLKNVYQLPDAYSIEDLPYFLLAQYPKRKALWYYTLLQQCNRAAKAFDAKSQGANNFN